MKMNEITIEQLNNCVTIITEELTEAKSFTLGFWFPHGSRWENENENGISHFLEHMIFKGTNIRTAKKISDEIEKTGGYLNAFTTKEETCFYGKGINGTEQKHFEVLSDMIFNSTFPEKEIKREAEVVIDELNDIEDTPDEIIFDDFEQLLFPNSKLGYPIIGNEKNIRSFSREIITDYYKKNYISSEFYVVSSGSVKHKKIMEFAAKYFSLTNCNQNKRKSSEIQPNIISNLEIPHASTQAYKILGMQAVGAIHNDYRKLRILSILLGEGSSSRLFNSIREKRGIAYQINTFVNSYHDVSAFGVFLSTNAKNMELAKKLIEQEKVKVIEKGISKEEFIRAKNIFIGNTILSLEETSNRMTRLAKSYQRYNKIVSVNSMIEEVNSIEKLEFEKFAKQTLNNNFIEVSRIPEK